MQYRCFWNFVMACFVAWNTFSRVLCGCVHSVGEGDPLLPAWHSRCWPLLSEPSSFCCDSGFPNCWGTGFLPSCNFSWQSTFFSLPLLRYFTFLVIHGFSIMCLHMNFCFTFPIWGHLDSLNVWICVSQQFWKTSGCSRFALGLSTFSSAPFEVRWAEV